MMRQFNFARHWRNIEPHLEDRAVVIPLECGLKALNEDREWGDPPWLEGRGPLNGQRAYLGKLSYYQPWGRCHHIAPFAWAIGRILFPDLEWGFLTSEFHSVAVGLEGGDIEIVMDILNFKRMTAEESIDFVKKSEWKACFAIEEVLFNNKPTPELTALFKVLLEGSEGDNCCHHERRTI